MKKQIDVLHVEDNFADAELIKGIFESAGWNVNITRVDRKEDFVSSLRTRKWDLILSDNTLPNFSGLSALVLSRQIQPEVPFIFVSGTIGEEAAIESLKGGAVDYILKDHLARFPHAIERALKEAQEKRERKQLEEQFRQAQKMEVIGAFAGGIAHDFNNILTAILGFSDFILSQMEKENPYFEAIAEIKKASERAAALTCRLLTFSRKQVLQPISLNLNTLVKGMLGMFSGIVDKDIELTTDLASNLAFIKADAAQIEQIVLNLIVNARDAMSKGGKIVIQTENKKFKENVFVDQPDFIPGDYVLLSVRDTGVGMTDEVKSHLFEPFFTTKEAGKGTGLGLSTVFGIVKQSQGLIQIKSQLNQGTEFEIYFPATQEKVEIKKEDRERKVQYKGTETVLVLQKNEIIRSFVSQVLSKNGYTVLAVSSEEKAFQFLKKGEQKPIHLIFTDLVLPELTGKELMAKFRAVYPQVQGLFTSGASSDIKGTQEILDSKTSYLPKPFTAKALLQKIREVLDANI